MELGDRLAIYQASSEAAFEWRSASGWRPAAIKPTAAWRTTPGMQTHLNTKSTASSCIVGSPSEMTIKYFVWMASFLVFALHTLIYGEKSQPFFWVILGVLYYLFTLMVTISKCQQKEPGKPLPPTASSAYVTDLFGRVLSLTLYIYQSFADRGQAKMITSAIPIIICQVIAFVLYWRHSKVRNHHKSGTHLNDLQFRHLRANLLCLASGSLVSQTRQYR